MGLTCARARPVPFGAGRFCVPPHTRVYCVGVLHHARVNPMDINQNITAPDGCRCWANTYALGHEGHCCFVRADRNRRIDNGFKAVEDICHTPPTEPRSWSVSTMGPAELTAFIGAAEAVRDYGLEVIAGRATGWTVTDALARSDRAQLALNDLADRGVI